MNNYSNKMYLKLVTGVTLFSYLTFATTPAMAERPVPADSSTKRSFIVVPMHGSDAQHEQFISELTDVIREDLGRRHIVIGKDQTSEIVKYFGDTAGEGGEKIIGYLDRANDEYFLKGNAEKSLSYLDKTINELRKISSMDEGKSELLVKALIAKAKIAFDTKKESVSKNAISELLKVLPEYKLDRRYFPPNFMNHFESVRNEMAGSPRGSIRINSSPGAVPVFLNGIYAGVTPAKLINIGAGTYDLILNSDHRIPVRKDITVRAGTTAKVNESLEWDSSKGDSENDINDENKAGMIDRAVSIGNASGVDRVVLVGIDTTNRTYAMMVDVKTMQNFKTISYRKLKNIEKQAPKVASYFVGRLGPYADKNLLESAKDDVDIKTVVDHRVHHLKKKPFYKKPVFWTVVGLALLGGLITGVVLAAGGGGAAASTGTLSLVFE